MDGVSDLRGNGDLGATLDGIAALLTRYVAFANDAQVTAATLWVAMTHLFEMFETTPYLAVTSPEKRCGKTRLLDVLELVVAHPWRVIQPSDAVVFRKIEQAKPTLLLDEVDALYGAKGSGQHDGLRAMLNAGNRRGTTVPRCVGEGANITVREFDVYCPKALAGIGELPTTVTDRSIPIRLQRRAAGQHVDKFRRREAAAAAQPLREWLERLDRLVMRYPEVPTELDDRAADGWETLLTVADEAGGQWPRRARDAAVMLHAGDDAEDRSLGVRLLADLRGAFAGRDRVSSDELVEALVADPEAPWGDLRAARRPCPCAPAQAVRRSADAAANR